MLSGSGDGPLRPLLAESVRLICPDRPIPRAFTRRGLASFLRESLPGLSPDLVFLPGNYYFGLAMTLRRMLPRVAAVGRISNSMLRAGEGRMKAAARLCALRFKSRYLDRIILQHEALLPEALRFLGGPAARFAVGGHPVLDQMPPPPSQPPRPGHVVAAGRLAPQKNFVLAIEAMALLPESCTLTIYGEGPLRDALEARARAAGVADRVRFAGYCAQMQQAFAGARLFLLSSDYEGMPSVVVEALAHGVPAVATNCSPTIPALLSSPQRGVVVPTGDAQALADAVAAQLAAPPADPEILRSAVTDYLLDDVARRYLRIFGEALR